MRGLCSHAFHTRVRHCCNYASGISCGDSISATTTTTGPAADVSTPIHQNSNTCRKGATKNKQGPPRGPCWHIQVCYEGENTCHLECLQCRTDATHTPKRWQDHPSYWTDPKMYRTPSRNCYSTAKNCYVPGNNPLNMRLAPQAGHKVGHKSACSCCSVPRQSKAWHLHHLNHEALAGLRVCCTSALSWAHCSLVHYHGPIAPPEDTQHSTAQHSTAQHSTAQHSTHTPHRSAAASTGDRHLA